MRGYMQDTLNARLMGVESTGSGRRQSFRFFRSRACATRTCRRGESNCRRNRRVDRARHLREIVCRRPSRDRQGRLRLYGRRRLSDRKWQDHRAGDERDDRRQRARSDDEGRRGRQRSALRAASLHLREGRPARSGRRRHADGKDFVDHGRRHRSMDEDSRIEVARQARGRWRATPAARARRGHGIDRAPVQGRSARRRGSRSSSASTGKAFSLRVFRDGRKATLSTSDISPKADCARRLRARSHTQTYVARR